MKTSELIALLADRLAKYGDQGVFISTEVASVPLREVSDQDSFCIWLRDEPSRTENVEEPTVHQCCGCSCDVCAEGHNSIRPPRRHTTECFMRFDAATPENVEEAT